MSEIISGNKILSVVHDEPFWRLLKAESGSSGEQLWFRILYEQFAKDAELVQSFVRIAECSANLHHPFIAPVIRHGSEDVIHYIVMEPFDGEPLSNFIKTNGPLSESQAVKVIVKICQALQYAKLSGTVHGCLTADSIFINSHHEITILNFGCDKFFAKVIPLLEKDDAANYAMYLSPQQMGGQEATSSHSDIFALGVLLYYILSGKFPYQADRIDHMMTLKEQVVPRIREENKAVSQNLETIIIRLLGQGFQHRFHSVTELVRILAPETVSRDALPDPNFINEPVTTQERIQKYLDRLPAGLTALIPTWVGAKRRFAVFLLTAISILALAVLVILLSQGGPSNSPELEGLYQDILEHPADQSQALTTGPETGLTVSQPAKETIELPVKAPDSLQEPLGFKTDLSEPTGEIAPPTTDEDEAETEIAVLDSLSSDFTLHVSVAGMPVIANVFVDGQGAGTTDTQGNILVAEALPGKSLQFRIEKNGFQPWEERLDVTETNRFGIGINLRPQPDAIRRFIVRDVGFADRVIIDNKLPSNRLPAEIDLTPGPHRFRYIESKSMFTIDTTLFLDMDSPREIFIDAASLGYGVLSIIVQDAYRVGYAYVSVDGEEKLKTTPLRLQLPVGEHQIILFREGYQSIPQDTTIIVLPNRESTLRCRLLKNP